MPSHSKIEVGWDLFYTPEAIREAVRRTDRLIDKLASEISAKAKEWAKKKALDPSFQIPSTGFDGEGFWNWYGTWKAWLKDYEGSMFTKASGQSHKVAVRYEEECAVWREKAFKSGVVKEEKDVSKPPDTGNGLATFGLGGVGGIVLALGGLYLMTQLLSSDRGGR